MALRSAQPYILGAQAAALGVLTACAVSPVDAGAPSWAKSVQVPVAPVVDTAARDDELLWKLFLLNFHFGSMFRFSELLIKTEPQEWAPLARIAVAFDGRQAPPVKPLGYRPDRVVEAVPLDQHSEDELDVPKIYQTLRLTSPDALREVCSNALPTRLANHASLLERADLATTFSASFLRAEALSASAAELLCALLQESYAQDKSWPKSFKPALIVPLQRSWDDPAERLFLQNAVSGKGEVESVNHVLKVRDVGARRSVRRVCHHVSKVVPQLTPERLEGHSAAAQLMLARHSLVARKRALLVLGLWRALRALELFAPKGFAPWLRFSDAGQTWITEASTRWPVWTDDATLNAHQVIAPGSYEAAQPDDLLPVTIGRMAWSRTLKAREPYGKQKPFLDARRKRMLEALFAANPEERGPADKYRRSLGRLALRQRTRAFTVPSAHGGGESLWHTLDLHDLTRQAESLFLQIGQDCFVFASVAMKLHAATPPNGFHFLEGDETLLQ